MEVHGYTAEGLIDATIDGSRTTIPRDPANRHRQMVAEWEEQGNTIPDYVPPREEPQPTRTAKNAIWERATDAEAEQMEAALAAQPIRIRRIYEGATHIASDHELFPMMMGVLTALFGEARANELLAPTA